MGGTQAKAHRHRQDDKEDTGRAVLPETTADIRCLKNVYVTCQASQPCSEQAMLTSWPTMAGDVYWHSMPAHSYTEGEYRHPNVVGLLHSRDGGMPYRCPTKPLSRLKKLLEERSSVNRECQSKSTQIRGAQFELRLMAEQCALWGVQKSHTPTPPANRVVERGNRDLGNMQGMIRLGRNKEE